MHKIRDNIDAFLRLRDFQYLEPINLISKNKNLYFVNSATCVYMDLMRKGTEIEQKLYTIQPSLRAHNLQTYSDLEKHKSRLSYFSYFHQLGIFQTKPLDINIIEFATEFLLQCIRLQPQQIFVILPKTFERFKARFIEAFGSRNIHVTTNDALFSWGYGCDDLKGTAISFCTLDRLTKKSVHICDVVEVKNTSTQLISWEMGVSLEFIEMLKNKYNSILQTSTFNRRFLENLRRYEEYSIDLEIFLDSLLAYLEIMKSHLADKGRLPFTKNQLSVLRKFFKYSWVYGRDIDLSIEAVVESCIQDKQLLSLIWSDMEKQKKEIISNEQKYIKNLPFLSDSDPINANKIGKERWGLIDKQIEYILSRN